MDYIDARNNCYFKKSFDIRRFQEVTEPFYNLRPGVSNPSVGSRRELYGL